MGLEIGGAETHVAELAMELAVKGMVPDTTIGRKALTRLHIYAGENYVQVAQKPEKYEF